MKSRCHPVRNVRGRALWFGPEVEGELLGMPTAFVSRALTDKELQTLLQRNPSQVFLTETFRNWVWLRKVWPEINSRIITLACYPREVKALKKKLVGVRLFVRLHGDWALHLGPADHISVGVPYHLVSVRRDRMTHTLPEDYTRDRLR